MADYIPNTDEALITWLTNLKTKTPNYTTMLGLSAARYRVWVQVLGVDADFRAVATVTDSDATLSGLPSGKTVKVRVTAANDGGESALSVGVQAVMP